MRQEQQAAAESTFAPFQQALVQGWEKALESFQALGIRAIRLGQRGILVPPEPSQISASPLASSCRALSASIQRVSLRSPR